MGGLVFGRASRTAWHVGLFALAGVIFSFAMPVAIEALAAPTSGFFAAGIGSVVAVYGVAYFIAKDERLSERVLRDTVIALMYLFLIAPILSKEMLPPLSVNVTEFAEIGAKIEKGMVTSDHLSKVYADLWYREERVVPWGLADLSRFQPTLAVTIPRKDFEHTGRAMSKTKRGVEKREFDMLGIKFWLPLTSSEPDMDVEDEAPPQAAAGETGSSDTDDATTAGTDDATADGADDAADGADDGSGADKTDDADADAAADDDEKKEGGEEAAAAAAAEPEIVVASRSYVYMFVRAAPKLSLWPQPKMTKKMSKKERRAIAFAPVTVCGKLFNGIPRGEAVDAAAIKLNRDLPKDPNSLAFSMRASECPGSPWFFGQSGYSVYFLFIPILLAAQYLIKRFAAAANIIDNDEDDFAKEWEQLISSIGGMFASAKSMLGEHKIHDAPKGINKKRSKGGEHME